jgi:hypothetical protein
MRNMSFLPGCNDYNRCRADADHEQRLYRPTSEQLRRQDFLQRASSKKSGCCNSDGVNWRSRRPMRRRASVLAMAHRLSGLSGTARCQSRKKFHCFLLTDSQTSAHTPSPRKLPPNSSALLGPKPCRAYAHISSRKPPPRSRLFGRAIGRACPWRSKVRAI